ncbi:MAG: T9SS type A sorting domain-containing protein [Lewinellaceae bacterium]|nr:T9SS type A sorting domain-containing protein [Lewinellaceae bacterium]
MAGIERRTLVSRCSLQRNLIDKKVFTTGTYQESFDPSGLPPGVYFLSVKNDQNQMISQKIILQ